MRLFLIFILSFNLFFFNLKINSENNNLSHLNSENKKNFLISDFFYFFKDLNIFLKTTQICLKSILSIYSLFYKSSISKKAKELLIEYQYYKINLNNFNLNNFLKIIKSYPNFKGFYLFKKKFLNFFQKIIILSKTFSIYSNKYLSKNTNLTCYSLNYVLKNLNSNILFKNNLYNFFVKNNLKKPSSKSSKSSKSKKYSNYNKFFIPKKNWFKKKIAPLLQQLENYFFDNFYLKNINNSILIEMENCKKINILNN